MSKIDTIIKLLDHGYNKDVITKLVDGGFSDSEIESYLNFSEGKNEPQTIEHETIEENIQEIEKEVEKEVEKEEKQPSNEYVLIDSGKLESLLQTINYRNANSEIELPPSAEEISIERLKKLME